MFLSEILELVRAGYTKEQIDAMQDAPAGDPAPEDNADPAGGVGTAAGVNNGTSSTPASSGDASDVAAMLAEVKKTLTELQAAAIKNDSRGEIKEETAGDLLAGIITGGK